MNIENTVFVITEADRQKDGSYNKHIHSIWSSKEAAKNELNRIKNNFNGTEEHLENWRACHPIGQPDDLSVDFLEGKFYVCKSFYRIQKHNVKS